MSDRSFIKYLKTRDSIKLIIAVGIGILLLILGITFGKEDVTDNNDMEERVSEICSSVDGVGECRVLIYYRSGSGYDAENAVESVLIVCDGGDSPEVKLKLSKILSSLFGIGANRIRIEKTA